MELIRRMTNYLYEKVDGIGIGGKKWKDEKGAILVALI